LQGHVVPTIDLWAVELQVRQFPEVIKQVAQEYEHGSQTWFIPSSKYLVMHEQSLVEELYDRKAFTKSQFAHSVPLVHDKQLWSQIEHN
jgi:hypothetical protein